MGVSCIPTIFLIGDSTVEDNKEPFRGWGWALPRYLAEGVKVDNQAFSGRSARSFVNEGRFKPVQDAMQPGDLLMIQFGHNDEKDDPKLHTDPDSSYPEFLGMYCDEALERGATPVLVTPVCRRFFVGGGNLLYTHGEYPGAVRRLAKRRDLPLCDLKKASRELYASLGEDKTAELFVRVEPGENPDFPDGHDDKTHFNAYGAGVIAGLVAKLMAADERCAHYLKNR